MGDDAYITVGKVVGTHGIKGYLKVLSYADSIDTFAPGKELGLIREGKYLGKLRVLSSRPHKRVILLALEGTDSIETAKEWIGCQVCVDKASLPQPEQGSYYWYQIVGMEVFTMDNRHLGRVEMILPTGSNDVYVVRDGNKEVLVPALESVVVDIDLEQRIMKVDLPKGLGD